MAVEDLSGAWAAHHGRYEVFRLAELAVLTNHQHRALAERLMQAREARMPVPALTSELPELGMADAYEIQRLQIEARTAAGERVAGWKAGALSVASRALGMTEPFLGPIFTSTIHPDGSTIDSSRLIAPGCEPEIAFLIGRRLEGPQATPGTAWLAVEGVLAALEIADCRYQDWRFQAPDMVADGGCGAGLVVGSRMLPLSGIDLALEGMVWEQDGERVATATGAEVGGTPLMSVIWIANKLAEWDMALEPGQIVAGGALSPVRRPCPGHTFRARFTRLGSVSVRFA